MARRLFETRAKAVEFDLEALTNDDEVKSGFLCLSETTWELAYNLVLAYGDWRSRYYVTNPTTGDAEQITDEEYEQTVLPLYYLAVEELNMSGCSDLVTAVDNLAAQVGLINVALQGGGAGCGCDGGVLDPAELDIDDVPIGSGELFENFGAYQTAKCRVANVILDKVVHNVRLMDGWNLDAGFGSVLGLLTGLLTAALLSGPVGWVVAISIGAVSGIITLWATLASPDLGDLDTALAANQDDLICALFEAQSAEAAKTAFLAVLDGASVSAALQGIVGFMLYFGVTNELFSPTGTYLSGTDYLNDDYEATDCLECGPTCDTYFSFDESAESWTFFDFSVLGGVATGEYDEQSGGLNVTFEHDGSGGGASGSSGVGQWRSPFASPAIAHAAGTTITLRHSAPADGVNTAFYIVAEQDDIEQTQQSALSQSTTAGEVVLTLTGNHSYLHYYVRIGRSAGSGGGPASGSSAIAFDVCIVEA